MGKEAGNKIALGIIILLILACLYLRAAYYDWRCGRVSAQIGGISYQYDAGSDVCMIRMENGEYNLLQSGAGGSR